MKGVAYFHPLVPPEWIAAHGFQPVWQPLDSTGAGRDHGSARGVCPFVSAMLASAASESEWTALVLTTTCDQMRYAAARIQRSQSRPVFLMHVPATWQNPAARQFYRAELLRLGRFLVRLGAVAPGAETLARFMQCYDSAREQVLASQSVVSARQFAEAIARVRGSVPLTNGHARSMPAEANGIALALLGGPMQQKDNGLLDAIESLGGRIVLDATEGGQRTLPAPFNRDELERDPLAALVDGYFGAIPDVFRRPNTAIYDWLGRQLTVRGVRGIVVRRYLWCDLWHAEWQTLRQWSPVPLLGLDAVGDEQSAESRTLGRLEAFLEILRPEQQP